MRVAVVLLGFFIISFAPSVARAEQAVSTGTGQTRATPGEPQVLATSTAQPAAPSANTGTPTFPRERHFLSDREFWLSLEVLLFGSGVILVEFLLLRPRSISAEEALRVYAITLIIVGALFTVTAGFDNVSVAPAFGLLGTVAGYLLGRRPVSDVDKPALEAKENA